MTTIFRSPYEQYRHFNGKECKVLSKITKPDATHDAEVLPMYRIEMVESGVVIEAWTEEVHGIEFTNPCPRCNAAEKDLTTSRLDSKTHICSECGTAEAMEDTLDIILPFSRWAKPPTEEVVEDASTA